MIYPAENFVSLIENNWRHYRNHYHLEKIKEQNILYTVRRYYTGAYVYKQLETGKIHREIGPAIKSFEGTLVWYKDSYIHREDGPAIIYNNGTEKYVLKGKIYSNISSPNELIVADILF